MLCYTLTVVRHRLRVVRRLLLLLNGRSAGLSCLRHAPARLQTIFECQLCVFDLKGLSETTTRDRGRGRSEIEVSFFFFFPFFFFCYLLGNRILFDENVFVGIQRKIHLNKP